MTIDSSIFWYPQLRQIKNLAWKTSKGKNTILKKKHLPETVLSLEQLIFTRIQPVCFWEAEGSFASNGRSFIASIPNAHLEARANCRSPRTPQCSVYTGSIYFWYLFLKRFPKIVQNLTPCHHFTTPTPMYPDPPSKASKGLVWLSSA